MKSDNPYDERYSGEELYWGTEPSSFAKKLADYLIEQEHSLSSLIDLGCGEGRNALFMAKRGFSVTGLDAAQAGLNKMMKLAAQNGMEIIPVHGDVITYQLEQSYDIIFSTGTLHYLPQEFRSERFDHFKQSTPPGGSHAHSVFVEKPFIPKAPDAEPTAHLFKSGELMSYYWDWEIAFSEESVFDCDSGDVQHRHAVNRIIVRRPGQS
jgi:tellurite methyltransferase